MVLIWRAHIISSVHYTLGHTLIFSGSVIILNCWLLNFACCTLSNKAQFEYTPVAVFLTLLWVTNQLLMCIHHGYSAWVWGQTGDSRPPRRHWFSASPKKSEFFLFNSARYSLLQQDRNNMATTRLSNVCSHMVACLWCCERLPAPENVESHWYILYQMVPKTLWPSIAQWLNILRESMDELSARLCLSVQHRQMLHLFTMCWYFAKVICICAYCDIWITYINVRIILHSRNTDCPQSCFFENYFGRHQSFLLGHWYPCFGLLVASALGLKDFLIHVLVHVYTNIRSTQTWLLPFHMKLHCS